MSQPADDDPRSHLKGLKVLVVEDESIISFLIEDLATELGAAEVWHAASVAAAFGAARGPAPGRRCARRQPRRRAGPCGRGATREARRAVRLRDRLRAPGRPAAMDRPPGIAETVPGRRPRRGAGGGAGAAV